jgi:hypothetical protein
MTVEGGPLISVIVACYNQARFLSSSIESVLNQTYLQREVIVVDDGSSDHPETVANQYTQISFIQQANQGASAARNAGWRKSRGEFLVFLDADDRLLPNALSVGQRSFHEHPDCGFVFGRGAMIDASGCRLPEVIPAAVGNVTYEQFLQGESIAFPAVVMCRRAAFEEVGGFTSLLNGKFIGNTSDYDLYLRLASRHPVYGHGELIAEWRRHGANTSSRSLMMLESVATVLAGQEELVRKNERYRAARKKGRQRLGDLFGEQLIEELRVEVRAGTLEWGRFSRSVLALLRHNPQALMANVFRKATSIFHGASRSNDGR